MSGPTLADIFKGIDDLNHVQSINRLDYYKPYEWQLRFHNAEGFQTPGRPAAQRLAMCGNKVGKTYAHAMEVAIHATGKYPAWWTGTRFLFPPEILVCGPTNELVRDIWQRELFGDPTDDKSLGTGTVPKLKIGKRRPKTGVPNAYDSVRVQHVSGGWSRIYMRAYEQGWKKFQGIAFEYCGPDEEPPIEIWSQLIRAGLARRNAIIVCTMTPEEGMTEVVTAFMESLQKRPGHDYRDVGRRPAPHGGREGAAPRGAPTARARHALPRNPLAGRRPHLPGGGRADRHRPHPDPAALAADRRRGLRHLHAAPVLCSELGVGPRRRREVPDARVPNHERPCRPRTWTRSRRGAPGSRSRGRMTA
jgi:phage terminase large subunit-like protein